LEFEWDAQKAAANVAKHKVSFVEAATFFSDPLGRIVADLDIQLMKTVLYCWV
jgi:uncharacterized DUF497 family protein